MKTHGNRTFVGTVVFLDLGEESTASAAPELQQRVRDVVTRTVGHLAEADRILLDTGNGAVLCFPGDPEDAVFVAIGIRDSLQQEAAVFHDLQVRLGVNLGPVKVVEESPGHTQLLGEGLYGAQALLGFASPSQILASRSFFELVSSLSDEYRELFHHRGRRRPGTREVDFFELAPVGGVAATDLTWPAGATPQPGAPAAPAAPVLPISPAAAPVAAAAATPHEGWRPEALGELSSALAKWVGPLAPVLVKRSLTRTEDPRALCEFLAEALTDESDRAAFLSYARRWIPSARKPQGPAGTPAPVVTPGRLQPEERARLEAALAPHVGPIARLLVERVAHEAPDLAAASKKLANSIADGESRKTFLKTVTMVLPPPRKQGSRPGGAETAAASKAVAKRTPARAAQAIGGTQPLLATAFLDEEILRRAEQSLARAVGPMARALVRRAAKGARDTTELYAALAEELPEGPERDRFLASYGKS